MPDVSEILKCIEIGLVFAVIGMGIYLTFRTIDFPDLTCDGSFVLGSAVSSILVFNQINPYLALGVSFVAGACAGGITAFLFNKMKVSALLAGILVAFMLYSINLDIMQGNPNIVLLNKVTVFSHVSPLFLLCVIVLLIWGGLSYTLSTDLGLALKSIGQNKKLAQNGGINVAKMTTVGLSMSNALIALGGALFSQLEGFGDISLGAGTIIFGLAAVMIGEKLLPVRHVAFALAACIFGSIVYRILMTIGLHSEWLGLRTKDLNLITGLLVIGVMQIPVTSIRRHSSKKTIWPQ